MSQFFVAPASKGWPKISEGSWVETNDFNDAAAACNLTLTDTEQGWWSDFRQSAADANGQEFYIGAPSPRIYGIHSRNLCCTKAVVLPCMCAVAYMCPEHRPTTQQCVGSHD